MYIPQFNSAASGVSLLPVKQEPDPRPSGPGKFHLLPPYPVPAPVPTDGSIPPPGEYSVPLNLQQNLSRQDITYVDRYDDKGNKGSDGVPDGLVMNVKGFDVEERGVLKGTPSHEYTMDIDSVRGIVVVTDKRDGRQAIMQRRDDGVWTKMPGTTLGGIGFEHKGLHATISFERANGWDSQIVLMDNPSADAPKGSFFVTVQNDADDLFRHGAGYNTDVMMISVGAQDGNLNVMRNTMMASDREGAIVNTWIYRPAKTLTA